MTEKTDPRLCKEWAQGAAARWVTEFIDDASIDTADYQLCSFVFAAAAVALTDPDVARRVGEIMESPRGIPSDGNRLLQDEDGLVLVTVIGMINKRMGTQLQQPTGYGFREAPIFAREGGPGKSVDQGEEGQ